MKRLLSFVLFIVLLLSLASCGGDQSSSSSPGSSKTSSSSNEVSGSSTSSSSGSTSEDSPSDASSSAQPPAPEPEAPPAIGETATPLAQGETITDESCEFSLESFSITDDVLPPSPGRFYSHYEAEQGRAYADLCFAYKNTDTIDIEADEILSGTLVYAGQYQYSGFSIIEEDSRSDFTYTNITSIAPLSTEYLHYLFEIPTEVQNASEKLLAVMTIAGKEYAVLLRDGSEDGTNPIQEGAVERTEGEVASGEILALPGVAEFSLDYTAITKDVQPKTPAKFYSHYEADAGKAYVDLCICYRNLSFTPIIADDVLSASLTYAGKYEYSGFSMVEEDSRGDFTYSNITALPPLMTEYLHYLFEVPEEVQTSTESVTITFAIGGGTYTCTVR